MSQAAIPPITVTRWGESNMLLQDLPDGFLRSRYPVIYIVQQLSYKGLAFSLGYALAVWISDSPDQTQLAFCLPLFFLLLMGVCLSLMLLLTNRYRRTVGLEPLFLMPHGFLREGILGYHLSQIWTVILFLMCSMFATMFLYSSITEARKLTHVIFGGKDINADQHFRYYGSHQIQPHQTSAP